jgi:hypothetical protein
MGIYSVLLREVFSTSLYVLRKFGLFFVFVPGTLPNLGKWGMAQTALISV